MGTQNVLIDMGTSTPNGSRFTLNYINGIPRIEIGGGGINATTTINDGNWHHLAATYDNTAVNKFALYIDGNLNTSGNVAQPINTLTGSNLLLGIRVDFINRFQGIMDEVRVWNYARSQSQLAGSMNVSFCTPQPGLVAYYKMNQGLAGATNSTVTTVLDASGYNRTGTMNNFSLAGPTSNWVAGSSVLPGVVNGLLTTTACASYQSPSGAYTWTTTGIYADTIPSVMGCDSALTINLTILQPTRDTLQDEACLSYTSPSGSHVWTTSGSYSDTLTGSNGCDSILSIDLTIHQNQVGFATFFGCDSLLSPSGNYLWTTTGQYQDTLTTVHGCDSFLTAFVTIGYPNADSVTESACFSYTWSANGTTYTNSGTYTATLTNVSGCDSVVTLALTVSNVDTAISSTGNALHAPANAAFYQWIDCNTGQPINGQNDSIFLPTSAGTYACVISANGCTDTSGCHFLNPVSVVPSRADFAIFPNPTTGMIQLQFDGAVAPLVVSVCDALGQELLRAEVTTDNSCVDLTNLPNGAYFLTLKGEFWEAKRKIMVLR